MWLDKLVEAYSEAESPTEYFWWAGLSAAAAVLGKSVYLDRYYYKLWPNMYIALIGKSGIKKGLPISLAAKLVSTCPTLKFISGQSSIEGLVKKAAETSLQSDGSQLISAHAYIHSGEFHNFVLGNPNALTWLTELYNTYELECTDGWKRNLSGSQIHVKDPCFNLLVASNEILLADKIGVKDRDGGFIARTSIVYADKNTHSNPLTSRPKALPDIQNLQKELVPLAKISGEIQWAEDAKLPFEEWYYKLQSLNIEDATGTLNRLGDTALKVAMVLSVLENPDPYNLMLSRNSVETAIEKCEKCYNNLTRLLKKVAGDQEATKYNLSSKLNAKILYDLNIAHPRPLVRVTLVNNLMIKTGSTVREIESVIDNLVSSGYVETGKIHNKHAVRITTSGREYFSTNEIT